MYRFLAVFRHNETSQIEKIRTPVIEEILNRFPGFQVVDEDSDLLILHWKDDRIGMDTHRLSEKRGTILGHIFTPKPDGGDVIDCLRPPLMFSQMESDAIQGSSGKHLIDNYWGNYVAFIRGGLNKELLVIRSPFSTIQCYHFSIDGYSIIFSDFYLVSILKNLALN